MTVSALLLLLMALSACTQAQPPQAPALDKGAAAAPTPVTSDDHPHGHDATSNRSFADVERWSKVFDDPERDTWQRPASIVDALRLRGGMSVAEIGAGTGYMLRYLSAAVGPAGSVFAVEVESSMVDHLRQRAERERAANVIPVLGSKSNPRLPSGSLDLILFLDTYHHIDDRLEYMKALRHRLKENGRIAIVDWRKEDLPEGPPRDHKLDRHYVIDEMTRSGYRFGGSPIELPYHYLLIFEVAD